MEAAQSTHTLSCGDNGVMVCDLFVIDISCLLQIFVAALFQYLFRKGFSVHIAPKAADVLMYFFCHRSGEHTGIGPWIGDHFFLIQFLDNLQGLIRADLKHAGAVILKLCQIIEKRRIFILLFLLNLFHHSLVRRIGG